MRRKLNEAAKSVNANDRKRKEGSNGRLCELIPAETVEGESQGDRPQSKRAVDRALLLAAVSSCSGIESAQRLAEKTVTTEKAEMTVMPFSWRRISRAIDRKSVV